MNSLSRRCKPALALAAAWGVLVGCDRGLSRAAETAPIPVKAALPAPAPPGAGPVPVLLPADPKLSAETRISRVGKGYSAAVRLRGATVEITGFPVGGGAGKLVAQRTEYGLDASFSRDGGVYNLSLQCEAGARDARCRDERFIRGFAAGLKPATR